MNRPFPKVRRAVPVLSLAAASLVTGASSASAAGACPDPALEATVNINGTDVPGCRIIYRRDPAGGYVQSFTFTAPPGGGDVRVLAVGGGGGGSFKNLDDGNYAGGGGSGGAGGEVVNVVRTLPSCARGSVSVGGPGTGGTVLGSGTGVSGNGQGQGSSLVMFGPDGEEIRADGGRGAIASWQSQPQQPNGTGWGMGGTWSTTAQSPLLGGFGNSSGGGGGASNPTARAATEATANAGGTGAGGTDVSASFPGLAPAQVGGGGGGFGADVGAATHGGGSGGKAATDALDGASDTGGGGGGGAYRLNTSTVVAAAGDGAGGIVVVDYAVPASTSCSSTPGPRPPAGGSSGAPGSETGTSPSTVKATGTRVSGGVITTSVTTPGPGTAVLTAAPVAAPRAVTCTATRSFTAAGTARMTCVPGAAVQRLRRAKPVRVKLTVAFRPAAGGTAQTLSAGTVRLPRLKARPIAVTG